MSIMGFLQNKGRMAEIGLEKGMTGLIFQVGQ